MRKRGFTLVEVIVVVATIALLAAILLPVFARARAQARAAVCLSNERQLCTAFALYAQDYDDVLPDFHSDPKSAAFEADPPYWHDHFCSGMFLESGQPCFVTVLQPYVKSLQVTICPADTMRQPGIREITSYEYKSWLARGRSLAEIPRPSDMAILWEQWAYHEGDGHLGEYDRRAAMNVGFVDGHVKWRRLADTTTARMGMGPDLHGLYGERTPGDPLYGADFMP